MSGAGAILRLSTILCPQLSPLPQRGRGAGGEGCPHLPPTPILSHAVGVEGGDYAPHLPPAPSSPTLGRGGGDGTEQS